MVQVPHFTPDTNDTKHSPKPSAKTRDSLSEFPNSKMAMYMFKHACIYKQYCKRDLLYLYKMSPL